jgi:hypothetical protein
MQVTKRVDFTREEVERIKEKALIDEASQIIGNPKTGERFRVEMYSYGPASVEIMGKSADEPDHVCPVVDEPGRTVVRPATVPAPVTTMVPTPDNVF